MTKKILKDGYTNHEHLDSVGLIHMNGRVYDPSIGRFLSADPNIQAPHNLQNFNRYSYVNNNPLSYTDPSGYFFKKLFKAFVDIHKKAFNFVKKYWRPLVAIAITVALPGAAFITANFGAVATGAITGFAAGAVSTGSLKGALIGAFTGAALGAIGNSFGNDVSWAKNPAVAAQKTFAHGVVGGLSSKFSGGKFSQGFASMGATQAVSLSGVFDSGFFANNGNENALWRTKQAIGSGVVGGLGALAGGGNSKAFAYGTVQGTMSRFLNDLHASHRSNRASDGCKSWGTNGCISYKGQPQGGEIPQEALDAVVGFGDTMSGGATKLIRDFANISSPSLNSSGYRFGAASGGVYQATLGSGLLLKGGTQALRASAALTIQSIATSYNSGSYDSTSLHIVNISAGVVYGSSPAGRVGQAIVNFQTGTAATAFDSER